MCEAPLGIDAGPVLAYNLPGVDLRPNSGDGGSCVEGDPFEIKEAGEVIGTARRRVRREARPGSRLFCFDCMPQWWKLRGTHNRGVVRCK